MKVTKRNGSTESVEFDKITKRLQNLISESDLKYLDPVKIAQKVINNLHDGINTTELDILSASICAHLCSEEPNYGLLGGRICVSNLHKMTPNTFYECVELLMQNHDKNNDSSPMLNNEIYNIIKNNHEKIESVIDTNRDYLIDFFGFKTLERAYLMKSNGVIVERPQYMWMRVAIGIHREDLDNAFKTYNLMSNKMFTHASPTLFNAGSKLEQLSSCFLLGTEDSIEGIFDSVRKCAFISKNAGGVGLHISNIRASGSIIRKTNGTSNGIIPMLQVYNNVARYIDQGGRRPGSFAIYLEPWHADIFQFLELRKNTGSDTDRARDLFLAMWMPDLFMQKVESNDYWYLMCPDECSGLADVYGDEFNKLYDSYIQSGKYRKKVLARDVWAKVLESQVETGTPYILYKDHVNNKSNQKNIGIIKSSNLCCEILEFSDSKETAVCNLASIALNKFVKKKKINGTFKLYTKDDCVYCNLAKMMLKNNDIEYDEVLLKEGEKIADIIKEDVCTVPQIFIDNKRIGGYDVLKLYLQPEYDFNYLKEISKIICINLNKIIDVNYYPIHEAKYSNFKHRPIGIGVQGLADTYFEMRIPFESKEARELNKMIFETIYFGAMEASMELSKERSKDIDDLISNNQDLKDYLDGNNDLYKSAVTILENSKLCYKADETYDHIIADLKRTYAKGSYHTFIGSPISQGKFQFDLWNVKPNMWDWDNLRNNIVKYGVRNSLVTALMPTASTSQILGNNECFEPITNNVYNRRTQAGEFKLVNSRLIRDLINLNIWNYDLKQELIHNNGSVQNLNIPKELKDLYKIVWEIKQSNVIDQAAERAPFIDQTQSMNIFIADSSYNKIHSSHFKAWKLGLKTGIYYLRTKPSVTAKKVTVDNTKFKESRNDEECLSCGA